MSGEVVFRIHNRRGLGHLMRASVLAREWLRTDASQPITFMVRVLPDESFRVPGVSYVAAPDPECMGRLPDDSRFRSVGLLVDDTILPDAALDSAERWSLPRALILRQATRERHEALLRHPAFQAMRAIVVPHSKSEFAHEFPPELAARTHFVGLIAREPQRAKTRQLMHKYRLVPEDWFLISALGGGGFAVDRTLFAGIVDQLHRALRQRRPRLRHLVVLGPLSELQWSELPGMTVVREESELVHLFPAARGAVTGAGYNTVNELILARLPAVLLSGDRGHDDQHARAERFVASGFGCSARLSAPEAAVETSLAMLGDDSTLALKRAALDRRSVSLGNRSAVEALSRALG